MANVRCVIFSRDRAMQLDAALRSLFLHCHDVETAEIWVLHKATDERQKKQYQQLIKEYLGRVSFKQQQNFRQDLLSFCNPYEEEKFGGLVYWWLCALGRIGPPLGSQLDRIWRRTASPILIFLSEFLMATISKNQFVLFLVDDNIFIQDLHFTKVVDVLRQKEKLLGFSLRLGKNTTYCYSKRGEQLIPQFESLGNDIVYFDWTRSDGDFGYPLELSSSVYRLRDILPLIMGFPFDNPNVLEERMAFTARYFRNKQPFLACYQHSVAFCNPVNLVQSVVPNRAGEHIKYTTEELSSKFEQGERIQLETFNGFVPESCHQEVEFLFRKTGS